MTSKIINMAERIKDADDRLLESMFESAPIADDGFSVRVVKRVRRKLWLQRLALPVAAIVGGIFAIKPLADLVTVMANLSFSVTSLVPEELVTATAGLIPQAPFVVLGAMLLAACLLGLRAIED